MISIIICSRKADISQELKDNIAATIGCEYELCVIDNSRNEYNIFTAYNEGVRRAKGDILCFMHEDIIYHTNNWGRNVYTAFEDKDIGLIGIMGGGYLPAYPASWITTHVMAGQNLQGYTENGVYKTRYYSFIDRFGQSDFMEVAAVDGMWFCIPTWIMRNIEFDSISYDHFHCYDLDICMQIHMLGKKVGVLSNVLIEHKSGGNMNKKYFEQLDVFYHKWQDKLPILKGVNLTQTELMERDMMGQEIMYRMRENIYLREKTESLCYSLKKKVKRVCQKIINCFGVFIRRAMGSL